MATRLHPAAAWFLLLAGLLAACSTAVAQPTKSEAKLNVLLIVSDDLNCALGCYGNKIVQTPNIDRLAAKGVRFERAFANFPVCSPSRTSFLSGRYPETTGVFDNGASPRIRLGKDFQFLPEYFRDHGYFTGAAGKVAHIGNSLKWDAYSDPEQELKAADKGDNKPGAATSDGPVPFPWKATNTNDAEEPDGQVALRVVKMLKENKNKPFFIAAGFHRPHVPHVAPKKYFDLYPAAKMPLPVEPMDHAKGIPLIARSQKYFPKLSDAQKRQIISHYYACVSFLDAQVGIILDEMDRLNMWENTIVVFIGDHGWHLGEHGAFWAKFSLLDESARVPLIVAAPGKTPAKHSQRIAELVDIFPTLTELCSLKTPPGMDGKSFAPLLDDPARPWQKAAYTVDKRKGGLGKSLRTERWTLIEWPDGSVQLYDSVQDPREYANLAGDPQHAKTLAEMRELLKKVR